jgi:CTP:molybdopterin cytidylyltransferase MocA
MFISVLVLAAGSSSRMRGGDKLLETVEDEPLLRRQARTALATGLPVLVTLPLDRPRRAEALTGLDVRQVPVPNAAEGMAVSLRAGLAAAAPGAVLVHLADLPEVTTADLMHLLDRHREAPDRILRATADDGTPGHPVLFPDWVRADLMALSGDVGARDVLRRHADRVDLVRLPGRHAVTDLDTPEDWAAWRAAPRNGA